MQTTPTARTPSTSRLSLVPVDAAGAPAGGTVPSRPRVRRYRLVRPGARAARRSTARRHEAA